MSHGHAESDYNGISMTARVYVTPKSTVLDPQGQTIRAALNAHGHASVSEVRQGKYFEIRLAEGLHTDAASAEIDSMAPISQRDYFRVLLDRGLRGCLNRQAVWNPSLPVFVGRQTWRVDIALIGSAFRPFLNARRE